MISYRFEAVEEASVFEFCTSLPSSKRHTWPITSQSTWLTEIKKKKESLCSRSKLQCEMSEKSLESRENYDKLIKFEVMTFQIKHLAGFLL